MSSHLSALLEQKYFIQTINETYFKYFKYGARSSRKVDYFHSSMKHILEREFTTQKGYNIELEYNIPSCNASGKKKCDIVILKHNKPYIIFPVKVIMTNYKQNKNNSWENLTGELMHIKWKNPNIHIVPINVIMDKTPYLGNDKTIKKFEYVGAQDIEIYNELIKRDICFDMINYIVLVEHVKNINSYFDNILPVCKLSSKYRTFGSVLNKLL